MARKTAKKEGARFTNAAARCGITCFCVQRVNASFAISLHHFIEAEGLLTWSRTTPRGCLMVALTIRSLSPPFVPHVIGKCITANTLA